MTIGVEVGRQVRRKIERKPEYDDRGEEGIFYIVNADGTRYWAKEWYHMHDKGTGAPVERKASSCSPYWHKVKYYEYQLIHDAFPTHTINLVAGYDERIKEVGHHPTGEREYSFDMNAGRPTTVSVEITGDPKLSDRRNQAMREAYAVLLKFVDGNRGKNTIDHPFFVHWRQIVDQRMQEILGQDIHVPMLSVEGKSRAAAQSKISDAIVGLAAELKQRNPQSVIPEMLENGIMPTHPELNFIPGTKESHPRQPHGTFVEASILDLNLFIVKRRQALAEQPGQLTCFNNQVERYTFYRLLYKVFDDMIIFANYGPNDNWKFRPEVQTALFQVTETIRDAYDRHDYEFDKTTLDNLQLAINNIFARGVSPQHVALLIQKEIIPPLKKMSSKKK